MTEIAVYEPPNTTSLSVWASEAHQAAQVAVSLAKTPFVPQSLRDRASADVTAANITAAILTGRELGLEPMAALRSIDVIQGTPALRAIALRALVQSAGHTVWVQEATESRAVVCGIRRGDDREQKSVWTLDRANKLGLTGKDNWKKQPGAMLVARATSELCRLVAADVILGVPYSVEELTDDGVATAAPSTSAPTAPTRRTAQRRTVQAVPDPPADPEPDFEAEPLEPAVVAEMMTGPQQKKMQAQFNDLQITDRAERLAITAQIIDRRITSSTGDDGLSKDEATNVIDTLEALDSERVREIFDLPAATA